MTAIIGLCGPTEMRPSQPELQRLFTGCYPVRRRPAFWLGQGAALGWLNLPFTPEDMFDQQPVTGANGRLRLVFAGRLDCRGELSAALQIGDISVMPDSALALRAFERWGELALEQLRGGWALALWNEEEGRLLLARDPKGQRALFYHHNQDRLVFASTLNGLLAYSDVPRELDDDVLSRFLQLDFSERDRTFYQNIRRVPGGECVIWRRATNTLERRVFWRIDPTKSVKLGSDEVYVDAVQSLLDKAVAEQLRSAAPLCVIGSGGFDSSAVGATAARLSAPNRLTYYSRVPPQGWTEPKSSARYYSDETPKLEALAEMHSNLNLVRIGDVGLHSADEDMACQFRRYGMPLLNPLHVGWFAPIFDRMRAAGQHIALTGMDGNMTLSWTGPYAPLELVQEGQWLALCRAFVATARTQRRNRGTAVLMAWWRAFKSVVLAPLEPRALRQWRTGDRRASFSTRLDKDPLRVPAHFDGARERAAWHRAAFNLEGGELIRDVIAQMPAVDHIELRAPLGDVRLFELCLAIPEKQYWRNGIPKFLARRVLAGRLPETILNEWRTGDQCPDWYDRLDKMTKGYADDLHEAATSPRARKLIDLRRAQQALAKLPTSAAAAADHHVVYRSVLPRAVAMARFIGWFEQRNR